MKLSDYVVQFLVDKGVEDVFLVSGGGIMHLLESVGRHKGLKYWCNYHEQASAIAAEGYARMKRDVGVCIVTSGPGSTNALSGLAGAWVDSTPVVVISGQVRRDLIADYTRLRQLGPQEVNIVDMARPITKHAETVMDPKLIRSALETAFAKATTGRPGPVWVNIPLDVQAAQIDGSSLPHGLSESDLKWEPTERSREMVLEILRMLQTARRPVLIAGQGIRLGRAERQFADFVQKLQVPIVLTIGSMDLMDENDPLFAGKFGPGGQRRANFVVQNADLIVGLGASLSLTTTGFNTQGFAPKAKKVQVNVDAGEFSKPGVKLDLALEADIGWLFEEGIRQAGDMELGCSPEWLHACEAWKTRYPLVTPDFYGDTAHVNSYVFAHTLSDMLESDDTVLTGGALDAYSVYQSFRVKKGQRLFTNVNFGAMGWDLPAAVGACIARGNRRTVLLTGDGSLLFNVQELMTIGHSRLNVKVFVINNQGYESIRATQSNFFSGHFVGSDRSSGVSNPDYPGLAAAYGLRYAAIRNNEEITATAKPLLVESGPVLCELNVAYNQGRSPKASSYRREDGTLESRPLEDMFPFLPREEIWENMHLFDDKATRGDDPDGTKRADGAAAVRRRVDR